MLVTYKGLERLLDSNGESLNSLFEKGVLTDHARRKLNNNAYVDIKHIANVCRYFNVPIEDVVQVIPKD